MANRASDNTFRGARSILVNGRGVRDLVGQKDRVDFFKFTASSQANFSLSLRGLRANASLKLFNANRVQIAASNRPGNRVEKIARTLNPGTYYVEVRFLNRKGSTSYSLQTTSTPIPTPPPPPPPLPPEPGETIATALDIGVLSTTYVNRDTIGTTDDPIDFYKFTLNDIANLDVRVNDSAQVRSIQLIRDQNNNGLVDSGEDFAPRPGSRLTPLDMPPGTYFIKVEGFSNVSSPYELTLVPTLFGGNVSPEPGNTLPLASNTLGVLSGTRVVKDYVGILDATDIYRFTLNDLSNLQITRTGSSSNPNVQLIRDSNNNGLIDNGEAFVNNNNFGILSDSANVDVPAGTYFIRVEPQINNFFSTSYELTLVETPYGGNGLPDPGNTLSTPRDLGVLSGTSSLKEYVGVLDSNDFYKFTLSNAASFQATLTIPSTVSSANNNVRLIQDTNNNGLFDNNDVILSFGIASFGPAVLTEDLQAGTYFLQVEPRFSSFSNSYELTLVTT